MQRLPDRFRSMPGFGDGKHKSEKWWKAFGESPIVSRHHTHTHTTVQRPFVRDYPGRPVPEETFTHSHSS